MIDKIYYGTILSILTGLVIWAIKAYVGNVLKHLTNEISHVKEGVDRVETGLKGNAKDLKLKANELKNHFDKTCGERQLACSHAVTIRIDRLEKHGHVGLKGDDSKITY